MGPVSGSSAAIAFGIVHHFEGGTKEQYEASVAAVHPGKDKLPYGKIFHVAGGLSEGGWTIAAVHESKESWERFRDQTLNPRLPAGIEGGFAWSAQETAIDIDTLMPVARAARHTPPLCGPQRLSGDVATRMRG
ncbi:MAG: hypothetical protein NVSMB55_21970 [Mycobacteriales bacterium]